MNLTPEQLALLPYEIGMTVYSVGWTEDRSLYIWDEYVASPSLTVETIIDFEVVYDEAAEGDMSAMTDIRLQYDSGRFDDQHIVDGELRTFNVFLTRDAAEESIMSNLIKMAGDARSALMNAQEAFDKVQENALDFLMSKTRLLESREYRDALKQALWPK
jgi:hypothetical protein